MVGKEIASLIVRTAPVWGIAVNALVANLVAKDTVQGKKLTKAIALIAVHIVILLLLAVYAMAA